MKTLYLLRHAKSSWDDASLSDFERPLNERGLRTATFMGSIMKQRELAPSIIISSPAKRAITTAELVVEASGLNVNILSDERVYEASPHRLLEVVSSISGDHPSSMIVGHNPGVEGLIRVLTGIVEPMPTAALAVLDLNIEKWPDAAAECGDLRMVLRPRDPR